MKVTNFSLEGIIDNLHEGLYFVDKNRTITYWNKEAERITGFTSKEVVGTSCSNNILTHIDDKGAQLCTGLCPLSEAMNDDHPHESEIYLHHKNGHRIPVSVRVSTLKDDSGNVVGGIELFTDISDQAAIKMRIRELEKLALLDNLTQLANRNYIERELCSRFEENKRFNIPFGILFIDIDHFKRVNDTYGHDIGDAVLKFVAGTFSKNARSFDTYGRWGGEEFIGIIRNISRKDLENLGNRLRILVENSYIMVKDIKLSVTISIGATIVQETDDSKTLLKRADTLLYSSKTSGRNRLTMN